MRIRELRERLGISQSELARQYHGGKHTSVIQWETGKAMPTADKLPKLAAILEVTIDELYKEPCIGA